MAEVILAIHRRFFYNSECWKKGRTQMPRGVQVHSTGANNPYLRRYVGPDDGYLGKNPNNNTHNRPNLQTCANAYIGKLADGTIAIYQALPWDFRCWLSGSGNKGNANKLGYIGFEVCEDDTEHLDYFLGAVRENAVHLTAYLCKMFGFYPWETVTGNALAVEDHASLHRAGLASDHDDISKWLRKFGYTFDDFRYWVQQCLDTDDIIVQYVEVENVERKTIRFGDTGDSVYLMQTLLCDAGENLAATGRFDAQTESAVRHFQKINGLTVDGICGPKTWAALEKSATHDADTSTSGPAVDELGAAVETLMKYNFGDVVRELINRGGMNCG